MTVTELRPHLTIGGSDAAAAAGIDPHRSRVMLWLEKTGRYERPETEAMRWGKLLEPLVFAELEERGYDATPATDLAAMPNRMVRDGRVQDPRRSWLVGHPDGLVTLNAEVGLLEVKTVGQWAKRSWNGAPPLEYVAQVQHYLHLTGLDRALLAELVGGQRLELHEIEREQLAIDRLLELEQEFYETYLVPDVQPPFRADDKEALDILWPHATAGRKVRLGKAQMTARRELRARRFQRDAIDAQVHELENLLKAAMGDAELAISPHDDEVLRWANVESSRVDVTRLREEHPEIAAAYVKTTSTRRFSVL